jgi:hypothetical protein
MKSRIGFRILSLPRANLLRVFLSLAVSQLLIHNAQAAESWSDHFECKRPSGEVTATAQVKYRFDDEGLHLIGYAFYNYDKTFRTRGLRLKWEWVPRNGRPVKQGDKPFHYDDSPVEYGNNPFYYGGTGRAVNTNIEQYFNAAPSYDMRASIRMHPLPGRDPIPVAYDWDGYCEGAVIINPSEGGSH